MAVQVGALTIAKPLLLWINDGPMAIFFLLVGLEIKREVTDGELSSRARAALPLLLQVANQPAGLGGREADAVAATARGRLHQMLGNSTSRTATRLPPSTIVDNPGADEIVLSLTQHLRRLDELPQWRPDAVWLSGGSAAASRRITEPDALSMALCRPRTDPPEVP